MIKIAEVGKIQKSHLLRTSTYIQQPKYYITQPRYVKFKGIFYFNVRYVKYEFFSRKEFEILNASTNDTYQDLVLDFES